MFAGMDASMARFEMRLPEQQRAELERLAHDTGLSIAGLMRLSVSRLLAQRQDITCTKGEAS
jgi:hypothetical protein